MNTQTQQLRSYLVVDNNGMPIIDKASFIPNTFFYIDALDVNEARKECKKIENEIGTSFYVLKYIF